MNTQQSSVISLVKSAVTGEKYALPDDFDFVSAARLANKHQIVPLIYYGALNCGIEQDQPIMQSMFEHTCRLLAFDGQQAYELNNLFEAFEKNKISYMPLKGTLLKALYPKSEMRTMSDADILIHTEQYGEIKPIMIDLGYSEQIESDHEYVWKKNNIVIELHKHVIPSYNKDYYEYYGNGWRLGVPVSDDSTRYAMPPEDEMIYLFTHFAKHYRDAGVGIKHILDLWVYKINTKKLDDELMLSELKKLQLDVFYKNIMDTLDVWFNNGEATEQTQLITQIIFNSGVYGTREAHLLSAAVKTSKTLGTARKTRTSRIIDTIFLPYSSMVKRYAILKKMPVLLPIMWMVRWFEALFIKKGAIKSNKRRLKTLSVEKITDYQSALNFVGLDFNFKE